MGYSAKKIVQTAIDTVNCKYGKVWYRRYNRAQKDGYEYNVGKYHDGVWSFDCLGFVHTMVNGFCGDTSKLGGGAVMDAFVNMSDEPTTLNKYCSVRGTFPKTNCKPASLLKKDGHVGLFIGERTENGQVINTAEVTTSMGGGGKFSWVDLSNGNRYSCKGGTYLGAWTNWGEFDRVDYDYDDKTETNQNISNNQTVVNNTQKMGVDICSQQGSIDFNKLKNAGITFIIPRDGWGEDCDGKQIDPKFLEFVSGALKVGIAVPAVYHFIYAANVNQAIENAKCAIRNVEKAGLPKSTIIWCDQEEDTVLNARKYRGVNLTTQMQTEITKAFCNYCLSQGYSTGIYLNQDYIKRVYGADIINKYDIWLADLEGDAYCKCLYRQVNWYAKFDGCATNVDVDEYYGQYTAGTAKPQTGTVAKNETVQNTGGNMSKIDKFIQALKTKGDGRYVYYNGSANGRGCSAYVVECLRDAGIITNSESFHAGDGVIGVLSDSTRFEKLDWNPSILKAGDILFSFKHHVAVWAGDGKDSVYEAAPESTHSRAASGTGVGLHVGHGYYNCGTGNYTWTCIYRIIDNAKSSSSISDNTSDNTSKTSTTVTPIQIALEILNGKWGNNPNRKNKITAQYGSTVYTQAQKYVDKIIDYKIYTTLAVEILKGKWKNNPYRKNSITEKYGNTAYTVAQNYVNAGFKVNEISNGYEVALEIMENKWGNNPNRKNGIVNKYGANVYTIAQDIVNNVFK